MSGRSGLGPNVGRRVRLVLRLNVEVVILRGGGNHGVLGMNSWIDGRSGRLSIGVLLRWDGRSHEGDAGAGVAGGGEIRSVPRLGREGLLHRLGRRNGRMMTRSGAETAGILAL